MVKKTNMGITVNPLGGIGYVSLRCNTKRKNGTTQKAE